MFRSRLRKLNTGRRCAGIVSLAYLAALSLALPRTAASQDIQQPAMHSWTVVSLSHVDLWYHALAIIGYEGFGPLTLYDPGYAGRIRREKESLGVYPTELDRKVTRFRAAFARDSTFEVLHFLPLYFASATRGGMFAALKSLAREQGTPRAAEPASRFGTSAIAAVLTRPAQRELLAELVDALEIEWRTFYRDYSTRLTLEHQDAIETLQRGWDESLGPGLSRYLADVYLDRGLILVSQALGSDGRIFEGDPRNRGDNIIAVRFSPASAQLDATLHSVVREMCFPLVRRVLRRYIANRPDRVSAERENSRSAVRCGALLLERAAPERLVDYRKSFISAENTPGSEADELERQFESAYPLDPKMEKGLLAEIRVAG